jgi:4-hydroxybenzoate polyprenyltransferase
MADAGLDAAVTVQRGERLHKQGDAAVERDQRTAITTATGLIALVRIRACLAGGGSVLLGAFLSRGFTGLADGRSVIGSAAIVMAIAAANTANDLVDLKPDRIGLRHRPLADGRLSVRLARTMMVVSVTAAMLLAFSAGLVLGLAMSVLLALAIGYSYWLKDTVVLGNAVVACCASAPVFLGGIGAGSVTSAIWAASALSFLFIFSYEVLKTLRDREPDAAAGLRTLATIAAPGVSMRLFLASAAALAVTVVAVSGISSTRFWYLLSIVPLLGFLSVAAGLARRLTTADIERSLRLLRVAWLIGLIDMLMLR